MEEKFQEFVKVNDNEDSCKQTILLALLRVHIWSCLCDIVPIYIYRHKITETTVLPVSQVQESPFYYGDSREGTLLYTLYIYICMYKVYYYVPYIYIVPYKLQCDASFVDFVMLPLADRCIIYHIQF